MKKLLPGIKITESQRRLNTKASESYVPVLFTYPGKKWEGWVPVEYRRTGVNIPEGDQDQLVDHLNNVYNQLNPSNHQAWLKKENEHWKMGAFARTVF